MLILVCTINFAFLFSDNNIVFAKKKKVTVRMYWLGRSILFSKCKVNILNFREKFDLLMIELLRFTSC